MTESHRSSVRLPHWGWLLLVTVALLVGYLGLSVWLPWHCEQQVIQRWGVSVMTETGGPNWLRKLVGERRMKELNVFERVTEVHLAGMTVNNDDITPFRELANIEFLSLDNTNVTDAGIAHLSQLTSLRILSLSETELTDACVPHLSKLTNLKGLNLEGTRITATAINELQMALPHCQF